MGIPNGQIVTATVPIRARRAGEAYLGLTVEMEMMDPLQPGPTIDKGVLSAREPSGGNVVAEIR